MGTGFKDLKVWQYAKDLAVDVYHLTQGEGFCRDFGLSDQMRRSAVSIPSNIAEGDERETDKEAVRFFYIAKGSAAELLTQAIIAREVGYLQTEKFEVIEKRCMHISSMLSKLIKSRSARSAKA